MVLMTRLSCRIAPGLTGLALALSVVGAAQAHALPDSSDPAVNARLDSSPGHVGITYSDPILPTESWIVLLDATGTPVATSTDPPAGPKQYSVAPSAPLLPGPYTVAWTSQDASDGHQAQGFYTFVVNGGANGIITGSAKAQAPAADLMATLTVSALDDGSSLLGVALNNTANVDRVRIRLTGPNLGEDLLTLNPAADGTWALTNNDVAVPGAWHADVIVRRHDTAADAQAGFNFTIDSTTGQPSFS
jgi:methionine-rich copper-binding protein CopC